MAKLTVPYDQVSGFTEFNLHNRLVLLIAPLFFGYEIEIANLLRQLGATVDFIPDRPFHSPLLKAVTRYQRRLVLPFADSFFLESIAKFGRRQYDFIFVIQGEGLSLKTLTGFKAHFPRARLIWYLWDSLKNKKSLVPNLNMFDQCFTFDAGDADRFGMRLRPLFYSPRYVPRVGAEIKYDLSFVGTAHSDRFKVISTLAGALPSYVKFYRYLYLQARWLYWHYRICRSEFKDASLTDFEFSPLSQQQVSDIFFSSFAVLDVEHPKQTGLTMRTFEAFGAGKKMITTNSNIRNSDIYSQDNIVIIERGKLPEIPRSFFELPFVSPSPALKFKYSLHGWLQDVFHNDLWPRDHQEL